MKMTKTVSKKAKKMVVPAKEFVAGQLAFYDVWDGGRGNSTTTTNLVRIRDAEFAECGIVVVMEDGSIRVVGVTNLRHLPEVFNGATI